MPHVDARCATESKIKTTTSNERLLVDARGALELEGKPPAIRTGVNNAKSALVLVRKLTYFAIQILRVQVLLTTESASVTAAVVVVVRQQGRSSPHHINRKPTRASFSHMLIERNGGAVQGSREALRVAHFPAINIVQQTHHHTQHRNYRYGSRPFCIQLQL